MVTWKLTIEYDGTAYAGWQRQPDRPTVQADRFLKQMVRAMVGTLVEVGRGKRSPKNVKEILEARDRRAAGVTAPAHGLYLVRVDY